MSVAAAGGFRIGRAGAARPSGMMEGSRSARSHPLSSFRTDRPAPAGRTDPEPTARRAPAASMGATT